MLRSWDAWSPCCVRFRSRSLYGVRYCGVAVLKELSPERDRDVEALQALLESAPDYSRRITGSAPRPSDGYEVLEALPPDLDPRCKLDLGLWSEDSGQLLGFADVVHGWPRSRVAHIGLLVVHGAHRGRGIGRQLHDGVVERAVHWGDVDILRLGIVATNAAIAEPFWQALGYQPTGETTPYSYGDVNSTTAIWERALII